MRFLDPTVDIAFKKVFGNEKYKQILISFLNSILNRKGQEKIVDVKINDPNNVPDKVIGKYSIVDVRATDQAGKKYIIEVQVSIQKDYRERCQYYSAVEISKQLTKAQAYLNLTPVIFIGVLDFNLLKTKKYISHHGTFDKETHEQELNLIEYSFIELKKFNKELKEVKTLEDKWIYFLKNADLLKERPEKLENTEEISLALDLLEQANWSDKEMDAYQKDLDAERVSKSIEETALEKGFKRGEELGLEKGIEKGIEKGEYNKSLEIAKNLLDILDDKTISKKTRLSLDVIKELKGIRPKH